MSPAKAKTELRHLDFNLESDSDARAVAARLVGQGRRVLELAAGEERVSRTLVNKLDCHVLAVEADRKACASLRHHCAAVVHGDIQQVNLTPYLHGRRFDAALLGTLLQRAADPMAVLQKLRPYLVDAGDVVATVANTSHGSARLAVLGGQASPASDPELLHDMSVADLKRLFARAGFMVETVERVRRDIYNDPVTDEQIWEPESVPAAVRYLLERDQEAAVAFYVVRARRLSNAEARKQLSELEDVEPAGSGPRRLVTSADQDELDRVEREAVAAREAAEARAGELEQALLRAEQLSAERMDELGQLRRQMEQAAETGAAAAREQQERLDTLTHTLFGREGELQQAREQVEQRELEIQSRERQIGDLKEQLESSRTAADAWIANLEADLAAREKELSTVTERAGRLAQEAEDREELLDTIRTQLDAVRAVAEEAVSKTELLEATVGARDGELGQMAERVSALQRELEDRGAELAESRRQTEDALARNFDLEATLAAQRREVDELNEERNGLGQQLEQRHVELASSRAASDEMRARIEELEATVALRDRELAEAGERVADLDRELEQLSADVTVRDTRICELDATLTVQGGELAATNQRLADHEQLVEQRTEQLLELEDQLETCQGVAAGARQRCEELEHHLAARGAELEQVQAQLELTGELLEQRTDEHQDVARQLEAREQELTTTRETLEQELTTTRATLEQELTTTRATLEQELTTTRETLEQELTTTRETLEQELAGRQGRIDGLEQELAGRQERIDGLERELAGRQERIDGLERELTGRQERIDGLERELTAGEERITELEQEVLSARDAAAEAGGRWVSRVTEMEREIEEKGKVIGDQESQLMRLVEALNAAKDSEVQVVELTRTVEELDRSNASLWGQLADAQAECQGLREEQLEQVRGLELRVEEQRQQLDRRQERIGELEQQLEKAERVLNGMRVGMEVQSAKMEHELERMRGRAVWRLIGQYDRAAQLLLPPGSWRRELFERVTGHGWREAAGRDVQPPTRGLFSGSGTSRATVLPGRVEARRRETDALDLS